ncbi:MAG TPA: hypothetical protein ENG43_00930, partial [Candidatus Bathyarchaeota archaeon]|nr:hypothetical protein [Candidatus Bathyarchaeota archaeon]HEW89892.1 hypothetical protein [Candidatus Bathyarchaeota archaeon]
MRPVGEVFRLKATYKEIKGELTPSLGKVIDSWMGYPVPTRFRDPEYVYESTCLTEPLKSFIGGVAEALSIGQPSGGPLERAFGFGKTHAMILLWHLLNSDLALRHEEFAELGLTEELVKSTLVLGMDFTEEKPFSKLVEQLKAYADVSGPAAEVKDHRLVMATSSVLGERRIGPEMSSHDMARLLVDVLVRYRERGGRPRLLLLIDELGYGASLKLKAYCEEGREELYAEVSKLIDFLEHLYAELERAAVPSVVIWAIADQDRRAIEALRDRHYGDELLRRRIEAVLKSLDVLSERYRRGTGGRSVAAFSYSPRHAIEIARFRVLKPVEGADVEAASKELLADIEALADQINIRGEFEAKKRSLEIYYPFSPGLVALMMKVMRPEDVPGTEFVRSLIALAAEAAERALREEPTSSFTIGVRHLELHKVACVGLLKDLAHAWASFISDVEHALEAIPEELRKVALHISKLVAAKGITVVLPDLLETKDKDTIANYGVSLDEIQLDLLASYETSEALKAIEKIMDAIEYLKAESGRIDEREVDGAKYY